MYGKFIMQKSRKKSVLCVFFYSIVVLFIFYCSVIYISPPHNFIVELNLTNDLVSLMA